MTATDEPSEDLDVATTQLYAGPLDGFIAQRDALARELRTAGRSDDSKQVKRLRKPSRIAWALDAAFFAEPVCIERVAAAVKAVVEAQSGRGDMRDATQGLRDAVHAAATVAADTAQAAGLPVDRTVLTPALLAVVADPVAFSELRTGRLSEVPTAGGLDALTDPPLLAVADLPEERRLRAATTEPVDSAARERARAAVADAEANAAAAREDAAVADRAVEDASAAVKTAEQALHRAETEMVEARSHLRDAQREAKTARTRARQVERDLAAARARLGDD